MKKESSGPNSFQVFVDEHSPEEAIEIDRIWKKKLNQQKNKRYTIIMLSAVAVMIIVFALLMSFFSSDIPKKHYDIQEITYMNTKYTYLQSNVPHLKFLVPFEDTKEIKILRTMGIIYQELIAWFDSNVAPNAKVLYIPNELTMINVLGITLGYYLKKSEGGELTIGVTGIKFAEMTEKNIELMNIGLAEPMPIQVVVQDELQLKEYDLIVLESSNSLYQSIDGSTKAKIIMIRREMTETTIKDTVFLDHNKFQIIKGRTNADIRALPPQYGYAIVPYVPSPKLETNNILMVPDAVPDIELCEQTNSELIQKPWVRNLVQHLKNESFANTSLLYAVDSPAGLQIIATLPAAKIFAINSTLNLAHVVPIDAVGQYQRSPKNIFIVKPEIATSFYLGPQDKLFVEIRGEQQREQVAAKFKGFNISVLSPFNNKGCFYPPALIQSTTAPTYFLFIAGNKAAKQPSN